MHAINLRRPRASQGQEGSCTHSTVSDREPGSERQLYTFHCIWPRARVREAAVHIPLYLTASPGQGGSCTHSTVSDREPGSERQLYTFHCIWPRARVREAAVHIPLYLTASPGQGGSCTHSTVSDHEPGSGRQLYTFHCIWPRARVREAAVHIPLYLTASPGPGQGGSCTHSTVSDREPGSGRQLYTFHCIWPRARIREAAVHIPLYLVVAWTIRKMAHTGECWLREAFIHSYINSWNDIITL